MSENWFEKIEDYIKGSMSHEEKLLFESELATNEELYAAFNIYQEIEREMRTHEKYHTQEVLLRKSLERLNKKYFTNESQQDAVIEKEEETPIFIKRERPEEGDNRVRKINPWKWQAAAVLTGLISLSVIWWYSDNEKDAPGSQVLGKAAPPGNIIAPDSSSRQVHVFSDTPSLNMPIQQNKNAEKLKREKLFAKNFEPDNLPTQLPAPLEDASAFYKARKPRKAIPEYKNLLAAINDTKNSDLEVRGEDDEIELIAFYAHYYLALSYMSVNKITNALHELDKAITKAPDKIWKNKVQWYLALAYLKTGQIQRAETLLKEVAYNNQANDYKQRAIELVKEISNE